MSAPTVEQYRAWEQRAFRLLGDMQNVYGATAEGCNPTDVEMALGRTTRGHAHVSYGRAVEIVRALGLDPVDFGV